ncbi:M50 family metallopeptidase [Bacillus sp. SM2101]|uniref:M50 family metallopeptidase n=1 Tax=Bacillus sp. SM2101 TaxID=2805366 RepID=UPI001BDE3D11|nr:M50 family metallopeptidase [Bacillus sp. SM2101]
MNNIIVLLSKVYIHPLLWFLIGIGIITGHVRELIMLFLIVFVHEMGHVLAAHFFSWRIKRIALLPFGGVAEVDEHGNRPIKQELIVILAGPLQHIWLLGVGYLLYTTSLLSEDSFQLFVNQNLVILSLNLLPIWPLDGGKLLFVILSLKQPFSNAHKRTLSCSFILILVMVVIFLIIYPFQLNLWMIIGFLAYSLIIEWRQRHYVFMRFLLERYYGKQDSVQQLKSIIVDDVEQIHHVLLKFQRGYKHSIIVQRGEKENASLDENELLHAYFSEKLVTQPIGDLLYEY